jgi:xylitol oxidase
MTTNWAGNVTYSAAGLSEPESVEELAEIVAAAPSVRALGSRHSFNRIADTRGVQVSVARLSGAVEVDTLARTATVPAGLRYGEIVEELDRAGWALHNLASLPHISVAGAVATGTHGSGVRNGSLASVVAGLELVTADGSSLTTRRGDPDFGGMVVALGCLGVVSNVTLDIVPTYEIRQDLYEHLSWTALADNFDAVTSSAYSVSLFTDWGSDVAQVWLKSRVDDFAARAEGLFDAIAATRQLHPLPGEPGEITTAQLGTPGQWWDRLPHFQLGFTPSKGDELQSEYLIPRAHALEAIEAVRELAPRIQPHLFISEIRTIAADDLWLSPSHSTDCVAIHFTWRQHIQEVSALLSDLDSVFAPLGGRPHWGKVFETSPERLLAAYPHIPEFRALAGRLDPTGKFRNDFVDEWIFG